jgi:hypothetical protein
MRNELTVYQDGVLFETNAGIAVTFSCIGQGLGLPDDSVPIFWIDYVVCRNVYGETDPVFVADDESKGSASLRWGLVVGARDHHSMVPISRSKPFEIEARRVTARADGVLWAGYYCSPELVRVKSREVPSFKVSDKEERKRVDAGGDYRLVVVEEGESGEGRGDE